MDSPTSQRDNRDRFITTRDPADEVAATLDLMSLNPESASPGHTARLAAATGVPLNRRILAYHEPPPVASSDPLMTQARELVRPLYARAGSAPSGSSSTTGGKDRRITTYPHKILDAPGMQDDFYLNLISWSSTNVVGIALGDQLAVGVHLSVVEDFVSEILLELVDQAGLDQRHGRGINAGLAL